MDWKEFGAFLSLGVMILGIAILVVAMIKLGNTDYRYIVAGTLGSLMATVGLGLFILKKL